ncbi:IPT/TIG domain-containing protein [Dactylosporangium sp. NPDC050588]|uniref:IPT/TIG domain-containing protein n=1 Tax=Dactylosporangium sp. NPDC050588 TaxID=3157211 RepID=UPI00340B0CB0
MQVKIKKRGAFTARIGAVLALVAAGLVATGTPSYAATTIAPTAGPVGTEITVTDAAATFDNTTYVQFQYKGTGSNTGCDDPARAVGPITASNATTQTGGVVQVLPADITVTSATSLKVKVPTTLTLLATPSQISADYYVCAYKGSDDSLLNATATVTYTLNGNLVPSATSGPTGGGNTITATSIAPLFTAGSVYVEFQKNSGCTTTYANTSATVVAAPAANVKVLSTGGTLSKKLSITVPTGVVNAGGFTTADWYICAYSGNTGSSPLLAGTGVVYTVGPVPTISTVTPITGPAEGGTTITVTGTNIPTGGVGMTATLGGLPLTGIVVAGDNLSFTAIVPAHSAGGPFALSLTTTGGTVTKPSVFTYTNGITVMPKNSPNTKTGGTDLDITGVGFSALDFSGNSSGGLTPDNAKSHVYLVRGVYNPAAGTTPTVKTNPQVAECLDVTVVDDTELICTLYTAGTGFAGANSTRALSGCTVASGSAAVVGSATTTACIFSSSDVGMAVTGTGIPTGTSILSYTDPTHVTLSKNTTGAVTAMTLNTNRVITDAATTSGSNTLSTSTLSAFNAGDVGRSISGAGIPNGTRIVSVSAGVPTLSNAATATALTPTLTLHSGIPLPNGTYTVTVVSNGAVGAQLTAGYTQTIISSGSTFTVADYLMAMN